MERVDVRVRRNPILLDLWDDAAGRASVSLGDFVHPREDRIEEEAAVFHGRLGYYVQLGPSDSESTACQACQTRNTILSRFINWFGGTFYCQRTFSLMEEGLKPMTETILIERGAGCVNGEISSLDKEVYRSGSVHHLPRGTKKQY